LIAGNEVDELTERHARYYRELFEQAAIEYAAQNATDWIRAFGDQVDNVRTALDWSFSENGDASIGVDLIAAVPLWLNLSLMDECRHRVQKALSRLRPSKKQAPIREMQLYTALGVALYSIGPSPGSTAAWKKVLEIARRLKNTDYILRALWGLWTVCVTGSEQRAGLSLAKEFFDLATEAVDPEAVLVGDRLIGISHHFLGAHSEARHHIERMLDRSKARSNPADIIRFQFDQPVSSRSYLAKVLWLQGSPDQAQRLAERAISDAQAISHALSLCYTLGSGACPVALLNGDLAAAERYVGMLLDHAAKHRLALWITMGRSFKGVLLIRLGDHDKGLPLLREGIDDLRQAGYALYRTAFLGELAGSLGAASQTAFGLRVVDEALSQSRRTDELWCMPELLRIKGELALQAFADGASALAEECFLQSLDLARRQEALSWQLRTAISFARLRRGQNRTGEARQLLQPVYAHFREGFGTADLKSAKQLLNELV
jgi:predicted ATPase